MSSTPFTITAQRVDLIVDTVKPQAITVEDGIVVAIEAADANDCTGFLIPGFVDSHIHIESSMLLPSRFAHAAVLHGTVATVSDPHEIANVCGLEGVQLMLRDAARTNFKFHFGAPSCVPATPFETSGARLDVADVTALLDDPRIHHLSEMMNFPGVLRRDPDVMAKISAARERNKPVDGHAPGLRGAEAERYVAAGISTDHECTTREEALDKLAAGCKIAIREGSAARNFEALESLIDDFPDEVMFCSDDKHPDELLLGHINQLAARAVASGRDVFNVLRACSLNAIRHYRMNVGLLQIGDPADFALVDDLVSFRVRQTFIAGQCVANNGQSGLAETAPETINQFAAKPIKIADIQVDAPVDVASSAKREVRVIGVVDGQLLTRAETASINVSNRQVVSDVSLDVLKLVVVNRYGLAKPAVAFVRGFGFRSGAIASTVAHDSHNIIAVGVDDQSLMTAINSVIESLGGLSVTGGQNETQLLPLPVAGLMSTESCQDVGRQYGKLDHAAKELGCSLRAPFMTLSFLALLVIPSLKLSDQGLFDGEKFEFVDLFV